MVDPSRSCANKIQKALNWIESETTVTVEFSTESE